MLNVVMLNVAKNSFMLNVAKNSFMLNVANNTYMLRAVMMSVVMLNVMAPKTRPSYSPTKKKIACGSNLKSANFQSSNKADEKMQIFSE
jgi:hypothetical protein